jgi:hypothetical protein
MLCKILIYVTMQFSCQLINDKICIKFSTFYFYIIYNYILFYQLKIKVILAVVKAVKLF